MFVRKLLASPRCWAIVALACAGHWIGAPGVWGAPPFDPEQSPEATSPRDARLQQATRLVADQQFQAAAKLLEPALAANRSDWETRYLYTVALYSDGRLDDALRSANLCIKMNPRLMQLHWLKVSTLIALGNRDAARVALDDAVANASDAAAAHLQRGRFLVLYMADDTASVQAAIEDVKAASRLGAAAEVVEPLLGTAYRKLGNAPLAERHLLNAEKLTPENLDVIEQLLGLYDDQGNIAMAQAVVDRLPDETPSSAPARVRAKRELLLARHAIASRKSAEVVERHFARARESDPHWMDLSMEYARWLEQAGRLTEAIPVLTEAAQDHPHDVHVSAQLAWAIAATGGDLAQAANRLAPARAKFPNDPYFADTAAWISYLGTDYDAAWHHLQPSLPLADRVPEIAYHAAAIRAAQRQPNDARQFLRLALKADWSFTGRDEAERLSAKLSAD